MATLTLRDRDAIVTREGLIFRVFGYSHLPNAYICDAEYAAASIFTSADPRAPREGKGGLFYKFYNDEGLKLVLNCYPQYTVYHAMLGQKVVGVHQSDIAEARKPEQRLQTLIKAGPKDELEHAMHRVLKIVLAHSGLSANDFGVFGSMLHGFHNPKLSDIDLLIYGKKENAKMRETLGSLYLDNASGLKNEFGNEEAMQGKRWRFENYSVKEFMWHQKRKQIYGLFNDAESGRVIKAEFEPVKAWSEIASEYDSETRILQKGWAKIKARVTDDSNAPFIPSVCGIETTEVLSGKRDALEARRVFSYMEEFRLQARRDEEVIVEGNLEEVVSPKGGFYQLTLTYCPRYYEQVLKVASAT